MSPAATIDEVSEHEGLHWKRRAGAQSTSEELAAARTFLHVTKEAALWNPWLTDDHEEELESAMAVMQEWTRAEAEFRRWTAEETQQWRDEGDRDRAAARAEEEARWKRTRALFDADQFTSRRGLLEQESIRAPILDELEEFEAADASQDWSAIGARRKSYSWRSGSQRAKSISPTFARWYLTRKWS